MKINELKRIADKFNVSIKELEDNVIFASSFPKKINISFKDYINAHFEVLQQKRPDNYSIKFKI
jgi:hypothetical protein